eukprot:GABV01009485.1.p1 GENE.GABV01009485.1~~GABV01009485.1.p1  ORF type:complete len:203 (-),score=44.77 GABV01009485.1:68-646(-)
MADLSIVPVVYQGQTCFHSSRSHLNRFKSPSPKKQSTNSLNRFRMKFPSWNKLSRLVRSSKRCLLEFPDFQSVAPSSVIGFVGLGALRLVPPFFRRPSNDASAVEATRALNSAFGRRAQRAFPRLVRLSACEDSVDLCVSIGISEQTVNDADRIRELLMALADLGDSLEYPQEAQDFLAASLKLHARPQNKN